jgi:hypothetical protein
MELGNHRFMYDFIVLQKKDAEKNIPGALLSSGFSRYENLVLQMSSYVQYF